MYLIGHPAEETHYFVEDNGQWGTVINGPNVETFREDDGRRTRGDVQVCLHLVFTTS